MTRFLLVFSVALLLGGTGALFLFVPPLFIAAAAFLLIGFVLVFVLGVQVGTQSRLPTDRVTRSLPPEVGITPAH